jgi:hypothetical protein
MNDLALETENLTRRYGPILAVDRINLQDSKGSALWIPGPERRRQDDDDPDADNASAAFRGNGEAMGP